MKSNIITPTNFLTSSSPFSVTKFAVSFIASSSSKPAALMWSEKGELPLVSLLPS